MTQELVLIAGAGPVGLTAAHRMARHGVPVRIVDVAEEPTQLSKALVVWRRTLQVLDATVGFEQFLAAGHEARKVSFSAQGKPLGTIDLQSDSHQLPAGVFVPQSETERILIEALAEQKIAVQRRTRLVDFVPDSQGVTCQLEGPDGPEQVRCSWLIGCDGAHSAVRHGLNIDFPGEAVDRRWILGDVRVDTEWDLHETMIGSGAGGLCGLFPVGHNRWRIIADGGDSEAGAPHQDPSVAELQAVLDQRTSHGWKIIEAYWRGEFRVSERQVENYVHGRVLLAGDAAHVHSPAGGQGMNTGIQDAANLAWKVALDWHGGGQPTLVESYQEERHPIGKTVVKATGRMLRGAMITNPIALHFRDMALHLGLEIPAIRRQLSEFLSEETVNLRGSRLNGPGLRGASLQPGDALMDVAIGQDGNIRPATDLLRGAEAVCLVFGSEVAADLPDRFGDPQRGFPLTVRHLGPGTETPHADQLAKALGLTQGGVAVIRPDSVVAAVGTTQEVVTQLFDHWGVG
jgi:2-polyprenyl-6-methoxyphenol hydroxylase-like FAD-dependent oxidoreductase